MLSVSLPAISPITTPITSVMFCILATVPAANTLLAPVKGPVDGIPINLPKSRLPPAVVTEVVAPTGVCGGVP